MLQQNGRVASHPLRIPFHSLRPSSKVGAWKGKDATIKTHPGAPFPNCEALPISCYSDWRSPFPNCEVLSAVTQTGEALIYHMWLCACVNMWVGIYIIPYYSWNFLSPWSPGSFTLNKHCLALGRENSFT